MGLMAGEQLRKAACPWARQSEMLLWYSEVDEGPSDFQTSHSETQILSICL